MVSLHSQSCMIYNRKINLVPSGEPQNIRAEVLSSISFQLEWSPPLEEHRNGVIMGYKIRVERGGVDQVYTIDTPSINYTITGLERGTTYHYSLAAYTIIGTGPYSNSTAIFCKYWFKTCPPTSLAINCSLMHLCTYECLLKSDGVGLFALLKILRLSFRLRLNFFNLRLHLFNPRKVEVSYIM